MYDLENPYEEVLPQLVSLQRKKSPSALKSGRNNEDQKFLTKREQSRISATQVPQTLSRDQSLKLPEPNNKAKQMENELKTKNNQKINEISKNLIAEMMNKISLKSISQQNYPISNETVQRLMINLDDQIRILTQEISKFQNSLLINPTNQHMKKELQSHEKNLNQLKTIKDLYHQKIENRSKVSDLQAKIMQLKAENRQLKIKIARGIEKIQSHIHNLPCQKQKQLIQEVNKYKLALNRQKQMRENLEINIQNINLNFKRFYEEADKSRKIVTEQLKNVQKKEQQLKNREDKLNHQRNQQKHSGDAKSSKGNNGQASSDIFLRKATNRITEGQNIAEIINQINQRDYDDQLKRTRADSKHNLKTNERVKIANGNTNALVTQATKPKFSLEEQIEKMRMNQSQFNKYTKKKS